MESLITNVRDLEINKRQSLEAVLGHELQDDQQIIIRVITPGVEQNAETKSKALDRLLELSQQAGQNAKRQGVSEQELDAVIDEAMDHVRYGKS